MMLRRTIRVWVVLVVAVSTALAGIGTYYLVFAPSSGHCVPGSLVAADNHTLTPEVLVNSPYLGSAKGVYLGTSPSAPASSGPIVTAQNGSVWGNFEDYRWNFSQGVHQGTSNPCPGVFFASSTDNLAGGTQNLGWELRNDSAEQTYVGDNGTAYAITYLNNSFVRGTSTVSTCGLAAKTFSLTSYQFEIRLPFSVGSTPQIVTVIVETWVSFSYTFPADSGTWMIDNLSVPGGPGGGWAFSYSPCP